MIEPVNYLKDKFLEQLTKEIFGCRARSDILQLIFRLRFDPRNFDKTHKMLGLEIAKEMNNGFDETTFNARLGEVIEKISNEFEDKMNADKVKTPVVTRGYPPNKKSPWQTAYNWFWRKEFPRRGWQLALDVAKPVAVEQLQLQPLDGELRALNLDDIPDVNKRQIKANKPYQILVDFQLNGHLLLINQSSSGEKYCICPSLAYIEDGKLSSQQIKEIPDETGIAKFIRYRGCGEEYFLAIVTEKPLTLSWLRPDNDPKDLLITIENWESIDEPEHLRTIHLIVIPSLP